MMNLPNLPSCAIYLKNTLSSFFFGDDLSGLNKEQIYGVMLVSALVSRNYAFAQDIEDIVRKSADKKTIALAKSTAVYVDMKKDEDCPAYLESKINGIDYWIYLLAASFICSFGSYLKLREKLHHNKRLDDNIINNIIRIAATVQSISEIHKVENEYKNRILVVDDEIRLTRMLKRTLDSTGKFEVRTENNGSNVLNAANEFKPDLILLDIIMRDMGGEEVAAQIRETKELCHTKIIFLTTLLTTEETGNTGKKIGGFVYLAKPVRDADLVLCIENKLSHLVADG